MKLLLAFASLLASASAATAAAAPRPNILLLLVDDLKPAIRAYGDRTAITPNLDRLVARGLRFDAAYCNQAVCASSRFTLLLGARSTTTGLYQFGRNFRDYYPDAVTLPQFFLRHGYRTESMGKVFHVGHGTYGDDASWSLPAHKEPIIEYADPASTREGAPTNEQVLFGNLRRPAGPLPRGAAWESPDVPDDAYGDARLATHAIARLRAAKEKPAEPFFHAVGFARPHLPFSAPKKYWDLYDPAKLPMPTIEEHPAGMVSAAGKRGGEIDQFFPVPKQPAHPYPEDIKRTLIHGYYASVSYVDAQIGKVMDALDDLRLADNTIVVLWGDHGWHLGDLGIWTKHTNFEQANRIPLVVIAPGVTRPGTSTSQLAETVDIYPTLAELAGLTPPAGPLKLDGTSLVPVLKNPGARVRDYVYHCYPRGEVLGRAIRTERFRLIEWKKPGAPADTAQLELYDYATGTVETRNAAAEQPAVVDRLRATLAAHGEARPAAPPKR
jgi:iduronate 2-sulfatase